MLAEKMLNFNSSRYKLLYVRGPPIEEVHITMPENAKPDRTVDCLGLFCPEPIFRVRMEFDNMKVGETVEVLADDPAAEEDIKSLCKRLGQEILNMTKEGSKIRFVIRKVK